MTTIGHKSAVRQMSLFKAGYLASLRSPTPATWLESTSVTPCQRMLERVHPALPAAHMLVE